MKIKTFVIDHICVEDELLVPVYSCEGDVYISRSDIPEEIADKFEQYGESISPKDFIKLSGGNYLEREAPFDIVMGEPIYVC